MWSRLVPGGGQEPFDIAKLITIEFLERANHETAGWNEGEKQRSWKGRKSVHRRYFWRVRAPVSVASHAPDKWDVVVRLFKLLPAFRVHAPRPSTQRALKYYPRHLEPFPGPTKNRLGDQANGRSSRLFLLRYNVSSRGSRESRVRISVFVSSCQRASRHGTRASCPELSTIRSRLRFDTSVKRDRAFFLILSSLKWVWRV